MKKILLPLLTYENTLPFYVYCVGGMNNQSYINRPDGYPHYIWLHTLTGKGRLFLDGKEFIIQPNTGLLIEPWVPHEYYGIKTPWETHWVAFQGFAVPQLLSSLGLNQSRLYALRNLTLLDNLLKEIYYAASTNNPDNGFHCSSNLYHFLIALKGNIIHDQNHNISEKLIRLQPVLSFLESHYHEDITLDQIAEHAGASPQYLCRLFKQALHTTPISYLTHIRIQKAKERLIQDQNQTITYIAKKVGYSDTSYFCAVFKKLEGVPPQEYRKLYS